MLFLAVFLGFCGRKRKREHYRRHREKEYVQLFIEDLQKDSIKLKSAIPDVQQAIKGLDTLIDELYLYIDGEADTD